MATEITTLKDRADFLRLRNGRKFTTPFFVMRMASSNVAGQVGVRVGYTVTTKCGNAVVRNRIKRRLRALVAEIFPDAAKAGQDYIIIALDKAKPNAADVEFAQLRTAMQRAASGLNS